MKNFKFVTLALVLIVVIGCSKKGIFPHPLNPDTDFKDDGLSDEFFRLSATANGSQKINEDENSITIPYNTSVALSVNELHRKIKDVKWIVNGKTIASGNNATVSINSIGINSFNVEFKEVSSGKKHNRQMKLYVYKEMNLSVVITPGKNICGEVAIGITSVSGNGNKIGPLYLINSVQQICTGESNKTARIARVPVKVYDTNTSFSIDLIEPNKTTTKTNAGFCFLFLCMGGSFSKTVLNPLQVYQTDNFSPAVTNNLKPGQYTSGGTVLTLE
ncbi:MAG: hypothetical protein QM594_20100 [Niabella sp.]